MTARKRRKTRVAESTPMRSRLRSLGRVAMVLGGVALAAGGGWFAWEYRDVLPSWPEGGIAPVQRVLVEGPFERVSTDAVEDAVLPHLRGNFFTVDLAAIQGAAERLPWVARAQVKREWPDGVHIVVSEERAVWRWGEDALLNERAERFVDGVRDLPPGLPRLDGPDGSERIVVERYLALEQTLGNCAMRIRRIEVDGRLAWRATLDGGLSIHFGRQDVDARAGRFCEVVLVALAARLQQVAYVDMRYTNGFAVGWRSPDAADPGQGG